jgi:hypothetical protein
MISGRRKLANRSGESYEYKELKLDNADDKAFFEGAMAWDLVVDGKEVRTCSLYRRAAHFLKFLDADTDLLSGPMAKISSRHT